MEATKGIEEIFDEYPFLSSVFFTFYSTLFYFLSFYVILFDVILFHLIVLYVILFHLISFHFILLITTFTYSFLNSDK